MTVRRAALDRVGGGDAPVEMEPVRVDQEHRGAGGTMSLAGGAAGMMGEIAEVALPHDVVAIPVIGAALIPTAIAGGAVIESVGAVFETIEAHESGALQSFMNAAFGEIGGDPTVQARRLGARAVLIGSSDAEVASMQRELAARPGGRQLVEAFRAGASHMETLRQGRPEQFEEARTRARSLLLDARSGAAAALEGGWSQSALRARSPVFQRAYEQAAAATTADPGRFAPLRRAALETRAEGFEASSRGHVDAGRYEDEPSYRHGVEHHRRMMRAHPEDVAPTIERLHRQRQVDQARAQPRPG